MPGCHWPLGHLGTLLPTFLPLAEVEAGWESRQREMCSASTLEHMGRNLSSSFSDSLNEIRLLGLSCAFDAGEPELSCLHLLCPVLALPKAGCCPDSAVTSPEEKVSAVKSHSDVNSSFLMLCACVQQGSAAQTLQD